MLPYLPPRQILDMDKLIKSSLEEERQKILEQTQEEATENAIRTVKTRLKEQQEAEQQRKEAGS